MNHYASWYVLWEGFSFRRCCTPSPRVEPLWIFGSFYKMKERTESVKDSRRKNCRPKRSTRDTPLIFSFILTFTSYGLIMSYASSSDSSPDCSTEIALSTKPRQGRYKLLHYNKPRYLGREIGSPKDKNRLEMRHWRNAQRRLRNQEARITDGKKRKQKPNADI